MNPPLVSICTPTFNRPEFLRRAVESCLAQTYPHFELIITDNSANPDGTANHDSEKVIAKFNDIRIRYFSNGGNIGPQASAIRAKKLSKGQYIKYLMDDDLLKPRCLELMVKALESNPTAAIAMAPMELIDQNDKRIYPRFYVFRRMHYRYRYQVGDGLVDRRRILKDFLTRDYPCTVPSGILFRAEAWHQAGELSADYEFAGDLEMCMRLAANWDFYYIDEVLSSWRYMPSSHTANLHETGLRISDFYNITRKSLGNESVKQMFATEWGKLVRDSVFFCSCRALLNGLAGLRARDPKLIWDTIGTIFREDRFAYNWLRLPAFVLQQIFISIFPRRYPPPRE